MAISQIITAFPPAPNAGSDTPEEFSNKADAFVAHQSDNYTPEVNQWATEANSTATDVNTSETNAQLSAWESEAEKLTADSYATQAEDVFVNVYTSNGDGTFTSTPTTEYSALHYSIKAQNLTTYDSLTDVDTNGVIDNDVMMWDATALKWVRQVLDWDGIALSGQDLDDLGLVGTNPTATLYPDGTIIANTSNGEAVFYPNGTLVCSFLDTVDYPTTLTFGGIHYYSEALTFPKAFLNIPIIANCPNSANSLIIGTENQAVNTSDFICVVQGNSTTVRVFLGYTANGRWR